MIVSEKPAKSFFSKSDLDLLSIYEVIQRGSSSISTGLYAKFIRLDTIKNLIKFVRPEILQIFLWSIFTPTPGSFRAAKNLYL